jgi:hypothetical protein
MDSLFQQQLLSIQLVHAQFLYETFRYICTFGDWNVSFLFLSAWIRNLSSYTEWCSLSVSPGFSLSLVTVKLAALFRVREVPDSKPDLLPFIISENFRAFPQDLRTGMKMAPLFLSNFFFSDSLFIDNCVTRRHIATCSLSLVSVI